MEQPVWSNKDLCWDADTEHMSPYQKQIHINPPPNCFVSQLSSTASTSWTWFLASANTASAAVVQSAIKFSKINLLCFVSSYGSCVSTARLTLQAATRSAHPPTPVVAWYDRDLAVSQRTKDDALILVVQVRTCSTVSSMETIPGVGCSANYKA